MISHAPLLAAAFLAFARAAENKPALWACPNATPGFAPAHWLELFDKEEDWTGALNDIQVYKFHIDAISKYPAQSLKNAVSLFKKRGIAIAVEAAGLQGGFCDTPKRVGARTAEVELRKIAPLYQAGGEVAYIMLDSPISHVIQGHVNYSRDGKPNLCQLSLDESIDQLLVYMQGLHKAHPETQLGLAVNFAFDVYRKTPCYLGPAPPDCGGRAHAGLDYETVLDRTVARVRAAKEELHFLHVDNPYSYTKGHVGVKDVIRERILPLREQARRLNLRFGLIFNDDQGRKAPLDPAIQDAVFFQNTLAYAREFVSAAGQAPDDAILESWYPYPHSLLPETQASPPSFTFLLRRLAPILQAPGR